MSFAEHIADAVKEADEILRLRAEVEASHSREMALRACLLKNTPEMEAENERLRAALFAIDHTLSVHGHVDANTDLHRRICDLLQRTK
jgi:hypothetical protein